MARKNVIASYKMFDNKTITADAQSSHTDVSQLDYASIDLSWSASTLTADVEVQVKNGKNSEWRTIALSAVPQISGASGSHEIILQEMPFMELRLAIVSVSGIGEVNAVLTSKSKGA